jgi:hypothetical protein
MKKRLYIVLGVCFLLLCAGSAWFAVHKQEEPQDSLGNFPAVAGELRELKEQWKTQIQEEGAEKAYAQFVKEAPQREIATHSQAHAFGEALYETEGLDGLRVCDSSFEFGCYHSFFGVAVNAEGIETLPKFDQACKNKYGDQNLPCQHGIGHGILVYTDYNQLEPALELCETISDLPTGGCSSGVFMEYNFHTMDDSVDFIRTAGDDLYEPCDTLPQRFQASCYFEQVQWWESVFNKDYKRIGELCAQLTAGSAEYTACYNGIGNYVAASAAYDFEKIAAQCLLMPDAASQGLCHEGASWLVRSIEGKKDDASKLCEILSDPYKSQCFQKLQ